MNKNNDKETKLTNSIHLNLGKEENKVAFLFSCPGQMEEDLKRPVACQTGVNLNILLIFLNKQKNDVFKYIDRYDYRITNAWDKVEFNERSGRTEAKLSEIKTDENIERLEEELKDIKTLILFGDKAKKINKYLKFKGTIISSRHLSFQSLNQIEKDIHGNILKKGQKGNTKKRLDVVANEILKEYNKKLEEK